uniref:Peptidase_M28 domain-containing protein n=1 Tax=Steinernema glaseri TaxID=37863 RepID=A0A1I8AKR8_9BILA
MRSALLILSLLLVGSFSHFANPFLRRNTLFNKEDNDAVINAIKKNLNWENIRDNLRDFTKEPHVSGTAANARVADKIAKKWKDAGLEDVHFTEYDVLLSYPNYSTPNHMSILKADGSELYKSKGRSPVVFPDEQGAPGADIQWVAYAGDGAVTGDVVYCHHGRHADFKELKKRGIDVKGKIALLRYAFGFRGDKVVNAERAGAIGAILYSDPAEVAKDGMSSSHVYPSAEWMPSEAVQRGSIMKLNGDPLTPLYPAKKDLYGSRTTEDAKSILLLPTIPVMPLSYSDAWHILSRMDGGDVPAEWQGGLNVTYKLGPGLKNGEKVKIDVKSTLEKRSIRNVVGHIRGAEEPDKYVILGNHFDAWVYGSIDPNSGTAILAEVARTMVQTMKETKWRPSRTILFCNWDGEEHGVIGSTEFVEEYANILRDRAVVYLNVDNIHSNQSLHVSTIPTLYQAAYEAAKLVDNPIEVEKTEGRKSLYDTWVHYFPNKRSYLPESPEMPAPGGGSDHAAFLNFIGVPVVDITYRNVSWEEYPLYHTLYETPFVNEHIFDNKQLGVHRAVAEYWTLLAKTFADAPMLPLNVSVFSRAIWFDCVQKLKKDINGAKEKFPDETRDASKQVSNLIEDAQRFIYVADAFQRTVQSLSTDSLASPLRRSSVNARLMAVDRCFVNPQGIPGQPASRHVLYSISEKDSYAPSVLAAVYNELDSMLEETKPEERKAAGRRLAFQISIVQYCIKCAVNTLAESI